MHVSVDPDVCAGTGQCEMLCPEVFQVGMVAEVIDATPDGSLADSVREAEASCPTGAIRVDD